MNSYTVQMWSAQGWCTIALSVSVETAMLLAEGTARSVAPARLLRADRVMLECCFSPDLRCLVRTEPDGRMTTAQ